MKSRRDLAFASLFLMLIFQYCNIKEPTAPSWDVSFSLPLAKKNYTLMELVEKNQDLLKHYPDGVNKNLIYYSDRKNIDEINIDDNLELSGISDQAQQSIGTIKIGSDSIKSDIGFDWIDQNVQPGTQVQIPPINNSSAAGDFSIADQFSNIKIESGQLDVTFLNHFPNPVSISLNQFTLKNSGSGEIIVRYNQTITIPPKQTVKISNLEITRGITVKNIISLDCFISTTGSNGQSIILPPQSLTIVTKLKNLVVTEASAKIPVQDPVVISGSLVIDEFESSPTKYQQVKLESGLLSIVVNNTIDIDGTATITFPEVRTAGGNIFSTTKSINRNQSVSFFNNFSLKDYSILSSGAATNKISYEVIFKATPTNDYRIIKSSDGIIGSLTLSTLKIKEFTGQLKPTIISEERTAVSLDVKDIQKKFKYGQLNIRNPILELRLKPSSNIEFSINGRIEARNSIGQKSAMNLNSRTMNKSIISRSDSIIILNADSVSSFFRKFTQFPDSIIVYAGGIVNPNYKNISVKMGDIVSGSAQFEFPLDLGLQAGEYSDSLEIDLTNDDRDKINNVNTLIGSLKLSSGIPAQIIFSGRLYDHSNKYIMNFPPKYSDQDSTIIINGASTDLQGNVITNNVQTISVRTAKGDAQKIASAKFLRIKLRINTTMLNNSPVKFKTSDEIKISVYGSTNYHVNPDGGSK